MKEGSEGRNEGQKEGRKDGNKEGMTEGSVCDERKALKEVREEKEE